MLFNVRVLIFTFSGTQVRIAEHERLQSLFKDVLCLRMIIGGRAYRVDGMGPGVGNLLL